MLLDSGENKPANETMYTICHFFRVVNTWYGGSGPASGLLSAGGSGDVGGPSSSEEDRSVSELFATAVVVAKSHSSFREEEKGASNRLSSPPLSGCCPVSRTWSDSDSGCSIQDDADEIGVATATLCSLTAACLPAPSSSTSAASPRRFTCVIIVVSAVVVKRPGWSGSSAIRG